MSRIGNKPIEPDVSLFKILVFSLFPSLILGYFTYIFFQWYIIDLNLTKEKLNIIYSIIVTVLLYLLSIYVGITYGRILYKRKSSKSLKNFKDFTDALHSGSTERHIYESLHNYLSNIFKKCKISIFYKNSLQSDKNDWTNLNQDSLPICNMSHKSCPVITKNTEIYVNDIKKDITCAYQLPFYKSGSYICLLLEIEKQPYAVIQLYHHNKEYFDKETVNDIKSYIEIIKPIISSKNKLKDLNLEAFTDKLTKVKNRTFLEVELIKKINESEQKGEPISLIILDIDYFKKINDTFGHPAGDSILLEFANIIQSCVRGNDLVARYGGEEFIVILPNSNIAYATTIAERIRNSVSIHKMPIIQGIQLPSITCSLGVSTYPDYAQNKEMLIKTADLALYSAKHSGRNRVVSFDPYNEEMIQKV